MPQQWELFELLGVGEDPAPRDPTEAQGLRQRSVREAPLEAGPRFEAPSADASEEGTSRAGAAAGTHAPKPAPRDDGRVSSLLRREMDALMQVEPVFLPTGTAGFAAYTRSPGQCLESALDTLQYLGLDRDRPRSLEIER
mmetsp:Transcript_17966/g.60185  ORF Transcript_17966/g.60185 Transcript_17966/m.60185 type:complete len:140 (+) Transcript_17966:1064-1483(+)